MQHQYQSNIHKNEFCDIVGECLNGKKKCVITVYGRRGAIRTKATTLPDYCFEGPAASYDKIQ